MGPLIPLVWTSCDVPFEFQSKKWSNLLFLPDVYFHLPVYNIAKLSEAFLIYVI